MLELPTVDAIGIVRYPEGYRPTLRPRSRPLRIAACVMLVLFAAVAVSTTVVSLGRYCLTSDGADATGLPRRFAPKPLEPPSAPAPAGAKAAKGASRE